MKSNVTYLLHVCFFIFKSNQIKSKQQFSISLISSWHIHSLHEINRYFLANILKKNHWKISNESDPPCKESNLRFTMVPIKVSCFSLFTFCYTLQPLNHTYFKSKCPFDLTEFNIWNIKGFPLQIDYSQQVWVHTLC